MHNELPSGLNQAQLAAATAPRTPLLIVAGAGTGKTLTLTHRVAHLIREGAEPRHICTLTFTNKAAKEMQERITRHLAGTPAAHAFASYPPFMGTFHSFGARVLRSEAPRLGRTRTFTIFDDQDSFSLIKKAAALIRGSKDRGVAYEIASRISALKNRTTTPEELRASIKSDADLVLAVFDAYETALVANNAFDFDDLIVKVIDLWESHPDVLSAYRTRYRHILVDEYQDINAAQHRLVHLLGTDAQSRAGSVSVVGDDHQIIYSWRGSDIDLFLGFESEWPGARTVFLEENYRSTQHIISAASGLIAHNVHQKPKNLHTANDPGEAVLVVECADEEGEAEWIARSFAERMNTDPHDSCAVLYRTNAQSRAIEQALIAFQLPYRVFGGLKFYERREVKDAIAALRYAANPQDSVSQERLQKTFTKRRLPGILAALDHGDTRPPVEILTAFLTASNYDEYLDREFPNPQERRENIESLRAFASQFSSLHELLEQIALVQAHDELQPLATTDRRTPITLTTIHLAKGLEFNHVCVAGVNESLLPHARSLTTPRDIEEERRLLYVAMTRARKTLALSFFDIPSRFLSEIPDEHALITSLVSSRTSLASLDDEERYISWD